MSDKKLDAAKPVTLDDLLAEIRIMRVSGQAGLTYADVALYINVSESTVRRMAKQPGFPRQKAMQTDENGQAIKRFLKSETDAWLKSSPII